MKKKKWKEELQFNILDAIRVAVLPKPHLVAAVASYLINDGAGLPTCLKGAHKISKLLTGNDSAETELADLIICEMHRQIQVKSERIRNWKLDQKLALMGSQLDRETRINRVCCSAFGSSALWVPVRGVTRRVRSPRFHWLHRDQDGTLVAGFNGLQFDELVCGFVFNVSREDLVRFGLLPTKSRNIGELLALLGLHPRLIGGPNVKVDWNRKAFLVGRSSQLPWTYP